MCLKHVKKIGVVLRNIPSWDEKRKFFRKDSWSPWEVYNAVSFPSRLPIWNKRDPRQDPVPIPVPAAYIIVIRTPPKGIGVLKNFRSLPTTHSDSPPLPPPSSVLADCSVSVIVIQWACSWGGCVVVGSPGQDRSISCTRYTTFIGNCCWDALHMSLNFCSTNETLQYVQSKLVDKRIYFVKTC